MRRISIILFYLFVIISVTTIYPTVSSAYPSPNESLTQYIIDLSKDIYNSITPHPDKSILYDSKGELKLKLLLSPWGELKDAYIDKSSGNKELDSLCLKAAWTRKRYQPFPEALGEEDRWIDVPIIFEAGSSNAPSDKGLAVGASARGFKVSGLEEAFDIALENNMAARIAREEIELSRLKIREARRALYPAASLNFLETTGRTTTNVQDFTDKSYKVKFEHPLYYGWRLKYAVSQADANMKASRYNYNKVLQDLRAEVEVAFYSYLTSKVNVDLQDSLLKEAEKIFDTAKKRFDIKLITKSEFMQVVSQLKQVTYQAASSKNELALARLTLEEAINAEDGIKLEDLIDLDMDMMDFEPVYIDVTLEECMELARENRPDVKSKEYMLEFNEYERKIQQSKNQLRVDLTGTYGRSGGAYETESLNLATDWYLGLKVSKPLGGNTISTAYTKEETSEKHGETSRTESVSRSIEFNFLDNLQSFSEKKSAEIALDRARDELQKTKKAIFREVKEAYLSYKKGLIQERANFNKIKYKEEELKIAKLRAGLNEMPLSGLMQAHMSLTDEKSYYVEALGSLYQSLARLNKATGYALFLNSETFMLANAGRRTE